MTDAQLDVKIATKVMGLRLATKKFKRGGKGTIYPRKVWYETGYQWQTEDGKPVFHPGGGTFGWGWSASKPEAPDFSSDIRRAFEVEHHIFYKLHLAVLYTHNLRRIVNAGHSVRGDWYETWRIAHASPMQRCLAALKAVSVRKVSHG